MELIVGSKYRLKRRIGGGSFGEIYCGEHIISKEEVAIKMESVHTRPPQLAGEAKLYRMLNGTVGVPKIYWYGMEGDYNVLVMELLGKSIEEQFAGSGRVFSLKTVLMLADQMITRVEYLHSKSYIHRDIKPDNFVFGAGNNCGIVYLIDYGLAKIYRDPKTHQHIPYRDGKNLTGTARYASINTHLGVEQSRRDDLEAIAYLLIYLMRGSLPWQGIQVETKKQKYEQIAKKKTETTIEDLCQGLPTEFAVFLSDVRRLEFNDRPDYSLYRQMLRDLFIREGYVHDLIYEWTVLPPPNIEKEKRNRQRPGIPLIANPKGVTTHSSFESRGKIPTPVRPRNIAMLHASELRTPTKRLFARSKFHSLH